MQIRETHRGHEFEIERRETDSQGGFAYELVLVVDGEDVTTASELEAEGWQGPESDGPNWTQQLTRFAYGYIAGLEVDR